MESGLVDALAYYRQLIQQQNSEIEWSAIEEHGTLVISYAPRERCGEGFTARVVYVAAPSPEQSSYYLLFVWGKRYCGLVTACTSDRPPLDYFAKHLLVMSADDASASEAPPKLLRGDYGGLFCHSSGESPRSLHPWFPRDE
jgi:hypothetical protein